MFCKKCGKEIEDNIVYCQFCGQKQDESIEKDKQKENGDVSDKRLILVGIIVAVVILAVIAIVKLVEKGKEDAGAETAVTEERAEEENAEDKVTENVTEPEEKKEEGAIEDAVEETEDTSDLQEDVKPVVKYMKVGDSECWYDEDGDLVKVSNTYNTSAMSIQYLTDEAGNKVCVDQMCFESGISSDVFVLYDNGKYHLIKNMYAEVNGDGWETESFEYSYDEKNRLIASEFMRDDNYNSKEFIEYLENGNKVMISHQTVYFEDGHKCEDNYEEEYNFDNGKMISYSFAGVGAEYSLHEWEYDANGNKIRENRDGMEYRYYYDENGNEIRSERSGDNSDWIGESQYDENGNLIRSEGEGNDSKENKGKRIDEYQYDESGRQTKYERNIERWTYDEEGNMIQHTMSDYNNVYEYNEEGKLISYAYLYNITGGDVVSFDSRYIYDELDRLSEIIVDGETAVTVSYNESGMPEKIDSVMEVDKNAVQWQLIYDLLPRYEQTQGYIDFINHDIIIEYR